MKIHFQVVKSDESGVLGASSPQALAFARDHQYRHDPASRPSACSCNHLNVSIGRSAPTPREVS